MAEDDSDLDEHDSLGPARLLLTTAIRLGTRMAAVDPDGGYALYACAARLARKVRGLGEIADFRLEQALDEADNETDPTTQASTIQDSLESLLGEIDEADPLPEDPLVAAQGLIEMAISIGAPAYNTGDHQGCYDVYSSTARMILATLPSLPTEPAARLKEALEQCHKLDDANEQAWAMRHAFDAIGEMGAAAEGIATREVKAVLSMAISIGAPAFNLGDHRGCYEVYACTARLLVNSTAVADPIKQTLRSALERASTVSSVTRQAWILRESFDGLLGGSSSPSPPPAERDE